MIYPCCEVELLKVHIYQIIHNRVFSCIMTNHQKFQDKVQILDFRSHYHHHHQQSLNHTLAQTKNQPSRAVFDVDVNVDIDIDDYFSK
jgi:hypothetical protein